MKKQKNKDFFTMKEIRAAVKRGSKTTKQLIAAGVLFPTLMGCSVTSLQCGTDGDSSFVNLNTTPKVLSQNAREMAKLCAFVYDEKES